MLGITKSLYERLLYIVLLCAIVSFITFYDSSNVEGLYREYQFSLKSPPDDLGSIYEVTITINSLSFIDLESYQKTLQQELDFYFINYNKAVTFSNRSTAIKRLMKGKITEEVIDIKIKKIFNNEDFR